MAERPKKARALFAQVPSDIEAAKLLALASGEVIAGPLQHLSPCGEKRPFHRFLRRTRGYVSVQNLGDCDLQIAGDSELLIDLPAVAGGHLGGSAEFRAKELQFACSGATANTCKFLWVIRAR
jgi:hypothetical protein